MVTEEQKEILRAIMDEAVDATVEEGLDPNALRTPGCYLVCKAFELLEASGAVGLEDELRRWLGIC